MRSSTYPLSYPGDVCAFDDARVGRGFVRYAGFAFRAARSGTSRFAKRRVAADAIGVLGCRSGCGKLLERFDVDIGEVFGHVP